MISFEKEVTITLAVCLAVILSGTIILSARCQNFRKEIRTLKSEVEYLRGSL